MQICFNTLAGMNENAGQRLKDLRNRAGITVREVAGILGMPYSTYGSREDKFKKKYFPADFVEQLVPIFINRGEPKITRKEVMALAIPPDIPNAIATFDIRVIGAVQAGEWLEALEWSDEDQWSLPLPDLGWEKKRMFALEVRGPSMNKIYPERSVIVCQEIYDLGREPEDGERVVVRRKNANGLIEATVKTYRIDGSGKVWLWPESTDPAYQAPISVEGEEVEIIAVVLGYFKGQNTR